MRLALLTGIAALSLIGAAGAQAQTVYVTDPPMAATDNVIATTPGYLYAVPAPPFGPFTPQYIVTQPTIVVAPPAVAPRERVVERERVILAPRNRAAAPRERVVERERVVIEPREHVVVAPREEIIMPRAEIVTTGSATSRSCFIDRNGFERCY